MNETEATIGNLSIFNLAVNIKKRKKLQKCNFSFQACVTVVTSLKSCLQRCEWNRGLYCVEKANKKVFSTGLPWKLKLAFWNTPDYWSFKYLRQIGIILLSLCEPPWLAKLVKAPSLLYGNFSWFKPTFGGKLVADARNQLPFQPGE